MSRASPFTLALASRCAEVLRFMYPRGKQEIPPYASPVIRGWSLERYIAEVMNEGVLAKEDAYVAIYLLHTAEIKYELSLHRDTYLPMVMLCALKVAVALRHSDTVPTQMNWSMAAHCIAPQQVIGQLEFSLRSVVFSRLKNAVGWRAVAPSPLHHVGSSSRLQAGPSSQEWIHDFTHVPEVDYVHLTIFVEAIMGIKKGNINLFLPCKTVLPLEYLFRVSLNPSRYGPRMGSLLQHELVPPSMNVPNYYRRA
ncbi:hypothetical protein C8Q80DRAFT_492380 [Daedaleopsis nitida]|nr:hypothetical protein C8Q80DRAFT_492380 [Daedaleopsis nitida]